MCVSLALGLAALGTGAYQAKRSSDAQKRAEERINSRPPTIDPQQRNERLRLRRLVARGRASGGFGQANTNLTGAAGITPASGKGAKTLLGG